MLPRFMDDSSEFCDGFQKEGHCEYEEMCHFAHGEEELAKQKEEKTAAEDRSKKNPHYKTSLCKSGTNCRNQDVCQFAHTRDELRSTFGGGGGGVNPFKMQPQASPMLPFGPPAGHNPFSGGGGGGGSVHGSGDNSKHKTVMCKSYESGMPCKFGTSCNFAHGPSELRVPGVRAPPMGSSPMGPMGMRPMGAMAPNSSPSSGVGKDLQSGKFKTVMCDNIMKQGNCPRGFNCGFAHSQAELIAARESDPKYKTSLCENWKQTKNCPKGSMCIFAHGMTELRVKFGSLGGEGYGPSSSSFSSRFGGTASPFSKPNPPSNNPKYRTGLCQSFMTQGYCDRRLTSCTFAHGEEELVNRHTYKTDMCRNLNENGAVNCEKGATCHYAHSRAELRVSGFDSGGGGGGGGPSVVDYGHGQMGGGGMGGGGGGPPTKRKVSNAKTALCTNYANYGECQWGENCTFAHGTSELVINKRQRI